MNGKSAVRPWSGILSLDLRSLALYRIAIGTCLLCDLLLRLPLIDDFYTDLGVLPRTALIQHSPDPWAVSIHLMSGEWSIQLGLHLLAIAFACGMIAGYRTRLCTAFAWFLACSMYVRNPLVGYGADRMLRALLFWSMFVPSNGRWSLDRTLNADAPALPINHSSWGAQALVLQLCFVYWFAAALKWDAAWVSDGSAIYYALNLDMIATPFGRSLLAHPKLLPVLTHGTLLLEVMGPVLVFIPIANGSVRFVVVLIFLAFHAALGLAMNLGLFSWVCAAAWLMFLPPLVWEHLERWPVAKYLREMIGRTVERLRAWIIVRRMSPPPPPSQWKGVMANAIVLFAMLLVFAGNMSTLPWMNFRLPDVWQRLASVAQLQQRWGMFAPHPLVDDGWYVIEGVLATGERVDVWNERGKPDYAKPVDVTRIYRGAMWVEYLNNIHLAVYQPYFGEYLCRTWNKRHTGQEQVIRVYVTFMSEPTPPPGHPLPAPTRESHWKQECSAQGLSGAHADSRRSAESGSNPVGTRLVR